MTTQSEKNTHYNSPQSGLYEEEIKLDGSICYPLTSCNEHVLKPNIKNDKENSSFVVSLNVQQ